MGNFMVASQTVSDLNHKELSDNTIRESKEAIDSTYIARLGNHAIRDSVL